MYNINEANELLDAIEILVEKSAKNNAVIYSGIVTEISTSVCTMKINGNTYSNIVYYGGTPIVGNAYRVFVPFGNMSQAFTLIFADTSPGESGVQSVNGKTGDVTLSAADVSAIPSTLTGTAGQVLTKTADGQEWKDVEIPTVDGTLTKSGQAADAKATGDAIRSLSEEIDTITLGKHTDGLVYVFLNGNPIGNGLNLSDASGGQVEEDLPVFANVTWDNTSYAIGNNHEHAYNAWAPNCAHYDSVVGKVMFLQCHRASHTGAFSASELIAIDPYNVMEYEVIKTFQPVNSIVPLCFTIFNGIYYIMSKNTVYTSDNHGKTWTETSIPVPLSAAYGLNIIDGVWYVGNDGFTPETDGVYHVSLDNGATWETKSFNLQNYSGELTCSEASFVKWNGKIYASLRRENANGLLVRQNVDGTWKVLTDTLPNVSSDCVLSVTKDRLCYAAINRPSVQVEIGTITISDDDTVSIEPFFTKSFSDISGPGDFHTPSYVYGPDFQMVTFMTNAVQPKEYNGAVNACIVGYADGVEAVGYDYDVITGHLGSNWSAEPYVGAAPDLSSGVATTVDNAVINYNGTVPTYYPSVDGDIVTFNAAANSACKTGILNNVGQAFMMPIMHALQNENGDWIACLSKKKDGSGAASLRFVAKTYKHTILSKPEIQGGTEFDCAVYKATAGSINTAYLSYPIPANLTKRLSVSG